MAGAELNDNMPEYADPESGTTMVGEYDVANMPGRLKYQLIKSGEMSVDRFITPPNMPGKKLKELRDAHRARIEEQFGLMESLQETNPYKVGDMVTYKDLVVEVLEVKGPKIKITNSEGKKVLVPFKNVTAG